ncbi:hypothetical protein [Arthrobacter sp. Alg241-R88]|uniref:hypothetical protein n=1 Tax=Arthrobacter sp. Alg241-R88 TaxID=2305984 RepID=UPI0013D17EB4|nr:hypothetical protein [Arthrobacter sp. Alg241-R88]
MAIAFGAIGAKTIAGTTTCAIAYPASVGAGDLLIAGRDVYHASSIVGVDEAGWTAAGSLRAGDAPNAADDHSSLVKADYLVAAGGETGTVTFDQSGTISGVVGVMARYTKSAGATWDVAFEVAGDTSHAADRSVTLSSAHTVEVGDWLVALVPVDTDVALTITAPTFTGTATFGTVNRRTSGAGATTGLDGNLEWFDVEVTGDGTCAGFTMTTATLQCGPVDILRLREIGGGSGADVTAVPATATADAPLPAVSAGATIAAVAVLVTAAALAPTVSAGSNVDAVAPTTSSSAAAPVVSGATTVTGGGPAAATMQAHAPVVTGGGSGSGSVTAVPATCSAAALPPVVSSGATVAAVVAAATTVAPAPTVSVGSSVATVPATASTLALPPTVSGGSTVAANVTAVRATATATALAPTVTGGTGSDLHDTDVVISLAPRSTTAHLADRATTATLGPRRTTATLEGK